MPGRGAFFPLFLGRRPLLERESCLVEAHDAVDEGLAILDQVRRRRESGSSAGIGEHWHRTAHRMGGDPALPEIGLPVLNSSFSDAFLP